MIPSVEQIRQFVAERFGPVEGVTIPQGGSWSSAYSFLAGTRELVLGVGHHREDVEKELIAATWCEPGLPMPDVLEVGEAFDCHFEVLTSIRRVVQPGHGLGIWHGPDVDAPASTWSEYLCRVADPVENRLVDWRYKHSLHPRASTALHLGCSTLQAKAGDLPAVRGLVHADLLLNHVVGSDNSITAVFDWGTPLRKIRSTTSPGLCTAFRGFQRSNVNKFST